MKADATSWIILLIAVSFARISQSKFEQLVAKVPSSANAVASINTEKLVESPVANRENWVAQRNVAFEPGATFLPPDSDQAVLKMQLDLSLPLPIFVRWLAFPTGNSVFD